MISELCYSFFLITKYINLLLFTLNEVRKIKCIIDCRREKYWGLSQEEVHQEIFKETLNKTENIKKTGTEITCFIL